MFGGLLLESLSEKQKTFLKEYGLNADEFLSGGIGADYYRFYHVLTGKFVDIRR